MENEKVAINFSVWKSSFTRCKSNPAGLEMHDQAGSIKIFQRKNETTIKEKQGSKDIEIK